MGPGHNIRTQPFTTIHTHVKHTYIQQVAHTGLEHDDLAKRYEGSGTEAPASPFKQTGATENDDELLEVHRRNNYVKVRARVNALFHSYAFKLFNSYIYISFVNLCWGWGWGGVGGVGVAVCRKEKSGRWHSGQ